MAEFFSPIWKFLFEKLGVGGIFVAVLAPFIMLALGIFAIVLIASIVKGIFAAVKKARCNKLRSNAEESFENGDYAASYASWMKLNKISPLSAEDEYTVSQVCACGEDDLWSVTDKNAREEYWLEKAVAKQHPLSFFALGKKLYEKEKEDPYTAAMGAAYIRTAARLGIEEATKMVAEIDKLTKTLPKFSAKDILFAASKGDIECQYLIAKGKCPSEGHRTIEWGTLAAEQGHMESQFQIGMWYTSEECETPNVTYAISMLERSVSQGHTGAMIFLGQLYGGFCGVKRNDNKSIEYYEKAAKNGEADGYYYLAMLYLKQHQELVKKKGLSKVDALHDKECLYLFDEYMSYMLKAEFAGSEKAKKNKF